jgi:NifU-like protein involved in Fe-S cluster formation
MKRIVAAIAIATLGGCGLETASTAATSAAIKKQELEQAKKTMGDAQQKIGQSLELQQQRAESAADGADK